MATTLEEENEVIMTEDRDSGLIAVIGMAGRFPGANSLERFWENLVSGADVRTTFTDEELAQIIPGRLLKNEEYVKKGYILGNVDRFDAEFFGYTPKEAEELDPQQRIFLECAWEAFEDAGHVPGEEASVGVYASITQSSYLVSDNLTMPEHPMPFFSRLMGNDKDYAAPRVAYKFGLKGPAFSVQSACSSSLVATATACQALLDYQCDMALAGGISISLPEKTGYLAGQDGAMSRDACCHAFDHRASGMMYGNGVGVVLLRRLEDALEDGDHIYGVVRGFAVNNDGADKIGFSAPGVHGQESVLREALEISGVEAGSITFIETHGTGTPMGDPMEVRALETVYGHSSVPCALGSVKTNVGHLNSAAGIAGFIRVMLSLDKKMLTPALHYEKANPEIDFEHSRFHVQVEACPWTSEGPLRAAVSSFGLGGTNCHMVLEEAPRGNVSFSEKKWSVIPLSARTEEALENMTSRLSAFLEKHPQTDIRDIARTLQRGRMHFGCRRALTADSTSSLLSELTDRRWKERLVEGTGEGSAGSVYFLFPGAGSQYVGMGRELYEEEPVYRDAVDECARILLPLLGEDIRNILYAQEVDREAASQKMAAPTFSFASLFATEYALARFWLHQGICPAGYVGHSFGQYLAAGMAGVFSLEDALAIAVRRGQLMDRVEEGAMLLLYASEESILPLLQGSLSIAAINAEKLCTVSGRPKDMEVLEEKLGAMRIHYRRVAATRAGHSALMEPILDEFQAMLSSVRMNTPKAPLLSNVSGTWMTDEEAVSPEYWTGHIRRPVRYSENIAAILKDSNAVLLEVGPGKILGTLARRHADLKGQSIVFSMRDEGQHVSDCQALAAACAALYASGVDLVWPESGRRISLPTYAFADTRYWSEEACSRSRMERRETALASMMGKLMEKKNSLDEWFVLPQWRRTFLPCMTGSEKSARVLILADSSGVADALAARLAEHGHESILIRRKGEAAQGELELCPGREEDMLSMLKTLKERGFVPDLVIHAWLVGCEREGDLYAQGYQSLVGLVRSLSASDMEERPIGIAVIADGMQEVTGQEILVPEKSLILGPCRVIPNEYGNIQTCSIDVEIPKEGEKLPAAVIDAVLCDVFALRKILTGESPAADYAETIAYRGLCRLEQTFAHIPLTENGTTNSVQLRRGGVYMITGGFGGVACELSRYLVKGWGARLVLVGRTSLPPRETWDTILASPGADEGIALRIRQVRELESMGGECLVCSADIADMEQMSHVCDMALKYFGVINGVFHAASTVSSSMIQVQTDERARAVINTKALGTRVIEQIMTRTNPDFVMLFSSLCSSTAPLGFADYAAGCCFMDTYARAVSGRLPYRVVSVNWGYWEGVGIGTVLLPKMMETVGGNVEAHGILAGEGMECIRRILALHEAQVMVSPSDYPALVAELRNSAKNVLRDYAQGKNSQTTVKRPRLSVPYAEPQTAVEKVIAAVWQEILGFDSVGCDDAFVELGGDSLHAIPMVSRLEEIFHTKVPIRALVTENTVRKLAAYLVKTEGKPGRTAKIAELYIKVKNMSDDEIKAMLARRS